MRCLRFLGDGTFETDHSNLVADTADTETVQQALLDELLRQPWDIAVLANVQESSTLARLVPGWCRRNGLLMESTSAPCPLRTVPESFDALLASLPSRFRTAIRSTRRKLAGAHKVEFGLHDDPSQFDAALQSLFDNHESRWRAKGQSGVFVNPQRREFYAILTRRLHERGALRFFYLKLDGRIVAQEYCFAHGRTVYLLQEGFDFALAQQNIGNALAQPRVRVPDRASLRGLRLPRRRVATQAELERLDAERRHVCNRSPDHEGSPGSFCAEASRSREGPAAATARPPERRQCRLEGSCCGDRSTMTAVPVVVLNMHYSGLGIARSLGPFGIPVYGLSSEPSFPGNFSRYCQFRLSPDSLHEPDNLRDFLLDFARTLGDEADHLPDSRPRHTVPASRIATALASSFIIPLADRDVIDRATNKDACLAIAAAAGISVPASHTVRDGHQLRSVADSMQYPVVVKPLYARDWRRPGIWEAVGHQKAAIIENNDELCRFYAAIEATAPDVSVQEYIPGPDSNLVIFGSYCRSGGEVRAFFTGRKLLQDPPLKGTGLIVEGVPIPEIVPHSVALLRALRFSGISEIEFKIHERTKVPYLIEINPRHWDQHYLGTACGVNLTLEMYRDLIVPPANAESTAERPPPKQTADVVRWVAEQDLFFHVLRNMRNRQSGVWKEIRNARGVRTYSVFSHDDPGPGRKQLRNAMSLLGRLALGSGA